MTFRSHFILWQFLTLTSILHSSIFVNISSCRWCAMTCHCHLAILFLWLSETYIQNIAPTKMFSVSSGFSLFISQKTTALWPFFPQLWHSPLKWIFPLFFFWLPPKLAALWRYFPQLLHIPLKNLILLLFIYLVFNTRTLYSSYFLYFLLPSSSILQNERFFPFRSL